MSQLKFGIGLIGFGTVGQGIYNLLAGASEDIASKQGFRFEVKKILVRRRDVKRPTPIPPGLLASSIEDILADKDIDIVMEVMGGESPAKEYIIEALKAGKHVITANKVLMGAHGEKLVERARQHERFLGYAAAVTGFHQFCQSITGSVMIKGLAGIFNGTSNYILTQMEKADLSFDAALQAAQVKGYAEADPRDDVEGFDTRNKLVVASRLAYGVFLNKDDIPVRGIRDISKTDMSFAKQLGYTIKLLGVSKLVEGDKISAYVSPALVPRESFLANVGGVNNGIQYYDAIRGIQGMQAEGAGSRPTAIAIFSDLVNIAKSEPILWPAATVFPDLKITSGQRTASFYVRLEVPNQPGILARITKAFGKSSINIEEVRQPKGHSETVPLVMVCGPVKEKVLSKTLQQLKSENISTTVISIPIEEEWPGAQPGPQDTGTKQKQTMVHCG